MGGGLSPPPSPTRHIHLVLVQFYVLVPRQLRPSRKSLLKVLFALVLVGATFIILHDLHGLPAFPVQARSPWRVQPRHHYVKPLAVQADSLMRTEWDPGLFYLNTRHRPLCTSEVVLHVLITSAPDHEDQRQAIRDTWCYREKAADLTPSGGGEVRCTFLIGGRPELDKQVDEEAQTYGDILVGDYQDTYRNLTLKVMSGLHWVVTACSSQYILKTDDDCFVNTAIFVRLLTESPPQAGDQPLYTGHCMSSLKHTQVIRNPGSKWAVNDQEYAPDYYPLYISGTGYLLSRHSARSIVEQSHHFVPFPVEDAYVGVLAEQAQITPEHTYRFTLISDKWDTCNMMYLLLIHQMAPPRQHKMWAMVQTALVQCAQHKFITAW